MFRQVRTIKRIYRINKSTEQFEFHSSLKRVGKYSNLCTPFKHDSRCALFSLLSFVTTNSTPQREAQRMSCLKGVQTLTVNIEINLIRFYDYFWHQLVSSKWHSMAKMSLSILVQPVWLYYFLGKVHLHADSLNAMSHWCVIIATNVSDEIIRQQ